MWVKRVRRTHLRVQSDHGFSSHWTMCVCMHVWKGGRKLYGCSATLPRGTAAHTGFWQMANLFPWGIRELTACTHVLPHCFPCLSFFMHVLSLFVLTSSFALTDSTERHNCWQIISFLFLLFFCLLCPVSSFLPPSFYSFPLVSHFLLLQFYPFPFSPLCLIK